MSEYKGNAVLVVNVATKCGLTQSNYRELGELADKYYDKGLRILCFPCNQFGKQEPGSAEEIESFACEYNPKFIMFEKIDVNGKNQHPLYEFLKKQLTGFITNGIKWNFTKFLIDTEGNPVKRYGPKESPSTIAPAIEKALGL